MAALGSGLVLHYLYGPLTWGYKVVTGVAMTPAQWRPHPRSPLAQCVNSNCRSCGAPLVVAVAYDDAGFLSVLVGVVAGSASTVPKRSVIATDAGRGRMVARVPVGAGSEPVRARRPKGKMSRQHPWRRKE